MNSSTSRWVSDDDFFNRELELQILETRVRDRNHILLTGQRRMGKTSVARELGRRLEAKGWVFLFTDVDEAAVVANLIYFMAVFYSEEELVEMFDKLIAEAARLPVIREGFEKVIKTVDQAFAAWSANGYQVPEPLIAAGFFCKAFVHEQFDDYAVALASYSEVIARFGGSDVPDLQERVAWAFSKKGDVQVQLNELASALASYAD